MPTSLHGRSPDDCTAFVYILYSEQGWVGGRLRLRPRLLEAGLFAKMLAFRPPSASKHSTVVGFRLGFGSLNIVFDGFGFGFGIVIFFSARFGLCFGFPEFHVWLPWFNRRIDKTS